MSRIAADSVRAELTIPMVLERYGFGEGRESGSQRRYDSCPACGEGSRGKFVVTDELGCCHACGFAGDLFKVLGAIEGLESGPHFARLVEMAAAIAGIDGDVDQAQLEQRLERKRRERAEHDARRAKMRERAEAGAARLWSELPATSERGIEYLRARGLESVASECRFTQRSACIALWRDGFVVNLVGRRFDGGSPKCRGLDDCGTRGTFGKPAKFSTTSGPIVIVEGWADWLSARVLRPERLSLGAHGCSNLPCVAEAAAKLARDTDRGLTFIPHRDDAGRSWVDRAAAKALELGIDPNLVDFFDVGEGNNDLNDWLVAREKRRAA